MITPNIASQFFETPSLCMGHHVEALMKRIKETEPKLQAIHQPNAGQSSENPFVSFLKLLFPQRQAMRIDDAGIAHIHILGPVGLDLHEVEKAFGLTDYLDLRLDFHAAQNAGARGVLLYGWSPGGAVSGSFETAQLIRDTGKRIPVFSWSEIGFFSAGTMLTVGASMCWGTRTGMYGNVGVIINFWDLYDYWADMGVQADQITNEGAELKDTFFRPRLTDAHRAFLQESVDQTAEVFQGWVAENRQLTDPAKVWTAGWWDGRECLRLGLLDALGTKQDTYDTLLGRIR